MNDKEKLFHEVVQTVAMSHNLWNSFFFKRIKNE